MLWVGNPRLYKAEIRAEVMIASAWPYQRGDFVINQGLFRYRSITSPGRPRVPDRQTQVARHGCF